MTMNVVNNNITIRLRRQDLVDGNSQGIFRWRRANEVSERKVNKMALDYSVIGSRIKEARLAKNMTQEDLADQIDISVAFLSRVERGNSRINLKRLNQVCNLLDVSEGYLLNGASSSSENYLDKEFSDLIKSVSPEKQKLIYNVAKAIVDTEKELESENDEEIEE